MTNTAEYFNPLATTWTVTGNMNSTRYYNIASVLNNGLVLVAGGCSSMTLSNSELYDYTAGMWTITENMNYARCYHRASVLANGNVLVTGGITSAIVLNSSELYQP